MKRTGGDELLAELPVRSTLAAEGYTTHSLQTMPAAAAIVDNVHSAALV